VVNVDGVQKVLFFGATKGELELWNNSSISISERLSEITDFASGDRLSLDNLSGIDLCSRRKT
jgi:hypothetical protein